MKNKTDFQKVLATWKAKSERNAKQLFSLGCKTLHLVWDKKTYKHIQRPYTEKWDKKTYIHTEK